MEGKDMSCGENSSSCASRVTSNKDLRVGCRVYELHHVKVMSR